MAADLFTAAADAILERVKLAYPEEATHYALVPHPMTAQEWMSLARNTPLITLGLKGFKASEHSGRRAHGTISWTLTLLVKNERGHGWRFRGDTRGPGLFPASEKLIRMLAGATFPGLGTLSVTAMDQAFAEGYDQANTAITAFDLAMLVEFGGPLEEAELADFLQAQITWTPRPTDGGTPGQNLPPETIHMRP